MRHLNHWRHPCQRAPRPQALWTTRAHFASMMCPGVPPSQVPTHGADRGAAAQLPPLLGQQHHHQQGACTSRRASCETGERATIACARSPSGGQAHAPKNGDLTGAVVVARCAVCVHCTGAGVRGAHVQELLCGVADSDLPGPRRHRKQQGKFTPSPETVGVAHACPQPLDCVCSPHHPCNAWPPDTRTPTRTPSSVHS